MDTRWGLTFPSPSTMPTSPHARSKSEMSKKPKEAATGNSEAIRIYERMEEERQRKVQAKAETSKPKKVTLPKLKFLDDKS
jgi:hypothetical protein